MKTLLDITVKDDIRNVARTVEVFCEGAALDQIEDCAFVIGQKFRGRAELLDPTTPGTPEADAWAAGISLALMPEELQQPELPLFLRAHREAAHKSDKPLTTAIHTTAALALTAVATGSLLSFAV